MCGRGALTLSGDKCRRVAGGARRGGNTKVRNAEKLKTKYNLGPMNYVPVVRSVEGSSPYASDREVCAMRWGLVPSFAKNEEEYNAFKGGNSTFNARIEGAESRNLWRRLLDKRRCIVLFDGFYEWKAHVDGKTKIPMFIRNKDEYDGHVIPWACKEEEENEDEKRDGHAPLLLAGLYDTWQADSKELLESVTILTMDPQHTAMEQVHDRMPVFLTPESALRWLDLRVPFTEVVGPVLKAAQAHAQSQLLLYEVSPLVSNIKNESPDCILPKKEYSAKQLTKGIGRFFKSKTEGAKQPVKEAQDRKSVV